MLRPPSLDVVDDDDDGSCIVALPKIFNDFGGIGGGGGIGRSSTSNELAEFSL